MLFGSAAGLWLKRYRRRSIKYPTIRLNEVKQNFELKSDPVSRNTFY